MRKSFKEIRITGLDTLLTQPSPTASDLRLMHLTLSRTPPGKWIEFFDQAQLSPGHTMWRDAQVYTSYLIVDCAPEEIERYLDDLKEDVKDANEKFADWAEKQRKALFHQVEEHKKERERIQGIADHLTFDDDRAAGTRRTDPGGDLASR